MSYVDSEVVFKARCDEIRLGEDTYRALKAQGWSTFGSYAFSISTNPGQVTDGDFDTKVSIPILGSTYSEGSSLRAIRSLLLSCDERAIAVRLTGRRNCQSRRSPRALRPWKQRSNLCGLRASWNQVMPSSTPWLSVLMMAG